MNQNKRLYLNSVDSNEINNKFEFEVGKADLHAPSGSRMKIKMVRDGLFMQVLLMLLKYQLSGIRGCILHQIKLKKFIPLKSMIGKNLINLI